MTTDREPPQPYGLTIRTIHWATALLILAAWVSGTALEETPRGTWRELAMQVHASLGGLVLVFAALRLLTWAASTMPRPEGPAWMRRAARAMHWALLLLTIALPVTGLADRWARGRSVTVFGALTLDPPFALPGGRLWGEAHETLAELLLLAVAVHALAALWHAFVLRDGALARMLPRAGRVMARQPGG